MKRSCTIFCISIFNKTLSTIIILFHVLYLASCDAPPKNSPEQNGKKVWNSEKAPWTPRGGATTCIFKNRLVMTGGKYGGFEKDGVTTEFVYSNDVWTLGKQ